MADDFRWPIINSLVRRNEGFSEATRRGPAAWQSVGQRDRTMYAGPGLSHYEFEMPLNNRKTDAHWKTELQAGQPPPQPEWTRSSPNP